MLRVRRPRRRTTISLAVAALVWFTLAVPLSAYFFTHSSRLMMVASHDSVVRPDFSGWVRVRTGPVLPDFRMHAPGRIGINVYLGKTEADSTQELFDRYAFIGSQPDGQVAKLRSAVQEMAISSILRGSAVALLPIGFWWLLGRARRRELERRLREPLIAGVAVTVVAGALLITTPWKLDDPTLDSGRRWVPLDEFLGGDVALPSALPDIWVRGDVTTRETRRLIGSAVSTFEKSKKFYLRAAADVADLELRQPEEGETVAILVSDRHDNIGMDGVARAIADAAGATTILDAGDDTSAGKEWEGFSLDSVSAAFSDFDRWQVSGNHDHGSFVSDYLVKKGWVNPEGEVVSGPGGSTLLGVDDPRASGLGDWRDEPGRSFAQVAEALADTACAEDEPVGTMLVHDANMGRVALERGCVDLVVGGHVHVRRGPDPVEGPDGQIGYSYTNGTTGGAAYAIAVGSKPRRPAEVSLITYADGRPVGIQSVMVQTDGTLTPSEFTALQLTAPPRPAR